jgi:hypothetical protein
MGKNGLLYVVDPNAGDGNGAVVRVDTRTGHQRIVSSGGAFTQPIGITLSPRGRLLVTDRESLAVVEVHPISGRQTIVSAGGTLANPIGVASAPSGEIVVADADALDDFNGGLIGVDPTSGAQRIIASGGAFNSPTSVIVARSGHLMVADYTTMIAVDPETAGQTMRPWGSQCVRPWAITTIH